jgi:hypothetical protein
VAEHQTTEPRPWMESDVDRLARELHEKGERMSASETAAPLESAFPDAYTAANYLRRRAFYYQSMVALLREARDSRAADILPDGWSDRVDAVLLEMDRD